jgi:Mycothiol maleylpyruvate isomerase N-terminal domain
LSEAAGISDAVKRHIDNDRFPEWEPFADAVQQRRPEAGTWCEAWTVRDIVVHQAGNAEELARVLGAHLEGEPVGTRGFEEREGPLRALNDADLWDALHDRMATLNDVAMAADGVPGGQRCRVDRAHHEGALDDDAQRRGGGAPCLPRAPKNYARLSSLRLG